MKQQDIDKRLNQLIEASEKDIDKVLALRLRAIKQQVEQMYRKYGNGGVLSRSDVYKYNRFQKELASIAEQLNGDYKAIYKNVQTMMQQVYRDNYLQSGYLFEMTAQTAMQYTVPSLTTINQAILNPIKELTLPALMNQSRNDVIRRINIELAQGIQAGEGYTQMAERLEKALGFSAVKAKRIARTEGGRVSSLARLASAEQASKYANLTKMWLSSLDTRVRDEHRKLDGKKADDEGYFHYKGNKATAPRLFMGANSAKLNINCRCTIIMLVNGKEPDVRRAKTAGGKSEVIPYVPYEQWEKSLRKG